MKNLWDVYLFACTKKNIWRPGLEPRNLVIRCDTLKPFELPPRAHDMHASFPTVYLLQKKQWPGFEPRVIRAAVAHSTSELPLHPDVAHKPIGVVFIYLHDTRAHPGCAWT